MKALLRSFVRNKDDEDGSEDSQNEKENHEAQAKGRKNKQVHFLENDDNELSFD